MNSVQMVNTITYVIIFAIVAIVILAAILCIVYFMSKKKKEDLPQGEMGTKDKEIKKSKTFGVESVMNFMEFDRIEDNMIEEKNGAKYVMVIECQGINYDLMSEVEKNAVEEGFIQFLNTIRHPVQIYTQTRTINLDSSLETYKGKVKEIEDKLQRLEMSFKEMQSSGRYTQEQLAKAKYELTKQRNLAEYGKDIIYNTERMSSNKNVLNQKYYVIVPYYTDELGQNNFDKEEIRGMAFSELYTRCQSIINTLSVCGVNGKILTSNELADLLYVAYNRDESETYGLDKALKAGFDELYSTAPDVLDKKMKELDKQIEEEAYRKANEKVFEAKSEKQKALERKKETKEDIIDNLAKLIIEQNKAMIGRDVAESAKEKVDEDKAKRRGRKPKQETEEGGTEENGQKAKRKSTKTA